LFEGSCHVPLIIARPHEANAGRSTAALVELVDLYPTLAECCALPLPKHLAGASAAKVLDDVALPGKETALTVAFGKGRRDGKGFLGHSIRTPRYRYTEWDRGAKGIELYDYQDDPEEFTNLARTADHAEVVGKMKHLLDAARKRADIE
jgi:uncharacterized sulfatase